MKRIALAALVSLAAAPALAGNLLEPQVEPPVEILPMDPPEQWSFGYAGVHLGFGRAEAQIQTFSESASGPILGVHAGVMHDLGTLVIGGEIAYDYFHDFDAINDDVLESILRLQVRLGYDMGATLPYVTAGAARASFADNPTASGWAAGFGVAHMLSDSWIAGAEVLMHQFDDAVYGADVDVTTVTLRLSRRF